MSAIMRIYSIAVECIDAIKKWLQVRVAVQMCDKPMPLYLQHSCYIQDHAAS